MTKIDPRLNTRWQKTIVGFFIENKSVIFCLLVLACAGAFVYRNSFGVPFLFDDWTQIVFNPNIQNLEWPWRFLENNRRPFLYATLAFNFHFNGLNIFGYHVFNVCVHILAAMSLFLLIYKTCCLPKMGESVRRDALFVALSSSLLWLCHPIQTQAVTYIIQRAESLMGLFFILALYFSVQYFTARKVGWLITAGVFSLLCGLTKEVALALPVVVLLYDRAFVSNSFRAALKDNRWLYLSLSLTWAVMLVLFFTTQPEKIPTAGFAVKGMTVWEYVSNQPSVILHYLRLAIWPDPLVFDYHWPLVNDISKLLPSIVVVFVGLAGLAAAFRRFPAMSFLGLSFFVVLAPSSSVIPLKDLIWEYRVYLPLSCLAILFTLLIKFVSDRFVRFEYRNVILTALLGGVVLVLGGFTDQRNRTYRSEETLWRDVLQKQPRNWRIWNDLGSHYYKVGQYQKSEDAFLNALRLNPSSAEIVENIAMILMAQKKFDQAVFYAQRAIELSPDFVIGYYNFAILFSKMGRYEEAIPYFEKAIQLGFVDAQVLRNFGVALDQAGRHREAMNVFKEAQRVELNSK